jgi:hypothetical protein
MLTGNDFIELLYLPISDNRVNNMMNILKIEQPIIDKNFKEDGYTSIVDEFNDVEVKFSDSSRLNINNSYSVFFTGIDFFSTTKIKLPLNIDKQMNYAQLSTLLGLPNYESTRLPIKVWIKQRVDKSFYTISVSFKQDETISKISLSIDSRKHLESSRYFNKVDK